MRNFDMDVRYVQNPAIGAALLWRFTCGYYANKNQPGQCETFSVNM